MPVEFLKSEGSDHGSIIRTKFSGRNKKIEVKLLGKFLEFPSQLFIPGYTSTEDERLRFEGFHPLLQVVKKSADDSFLEAGQEIK